MRLKIFCLVIIVGLIPAILELYADTIELSVKERPFLNQLNQFLAFDTNEKDFANGANDQPKPLEHFYVTILENDPEYGYTFQQMNELSKQESLQKEPRITVFFQAGLKPELYNKSQFKSAEPNATIEQRGQSTRGAGLKSYKIRLTSGTGLWRNQSIINLNKHPYEFTAVRNKLSFDYFKLIPNMARSETQFVKLHVRDLTSASGEANFVDYGLFTQAEQIDKDFLSRRGLDRGGYLYEAVNFEFQRYPAILRNRQDPLYDPEKFETVLAIRGRPYHDKLLQMLDDVNNMELDFRGVFNRYFDQDNFVTWIAVNILMANLDTSANNFYLYSSRFSDKWYFLPWDYDGAWGFYWQWGREPKTMHPFREGLSLYWGWPLARRFFQQPGSVTALNQKIEELSQIITEEKTKALLDQYYPVVQPLMLQLPDVQRLPADIQRFEAEYYSLAKVPARNRQKYYANLQKPMPVFMGGPWIDGGQMTFAWEKSYDLQGNQIFYDMQISKDPEFLSIYLEKRGLTDTKWVMPVLPAGSYYWRINILDSEGNEQIPFESFVDKNGKFFHGVKSFVIE